MPGWTNTWKRGWRHQTGSWRADWRAAKAERQRFKGEAKIVLGIALAYGACIGLAFLLAEAMSAAARHH